jgi:cephalosporin-C deacetylase-like acetyl esterase
LLDDDGKPRFRSTTEHTLVGVGSMLVGRNTAAYRIWDGMRSIDYLVGRPDIDPAKIGCTGCSGGGTLTSYLMALDERIVAAAPSCYLTSFERLIATIGPQDAEQNIAGQIAAGMDHADYVMMRAPQPTLICAATSDFFDITGTWDGFREAKRFYTRLGYPERVALLESDTKHGYGPIHREGTVRWMRRWLLRQDDAVTEPELDLFSDEQLQCTPKGQVMLLENARSVVDLNLDEADRWAAERKRFWETTSREDALAQVRRIAGVRPLDNLPEAQVDRAGSIQRDGYRVEKIVIRSDPGVHLPALLFVPAKPSGPRCLYLHDEGKQVDAAPGGPIEQLVVEGHLVLAVDLRGIGETGEGSSNQMGGNFKDIFLAYLLDKPLVGMRAEDVLIAAKYLSRYDNAGKTAPVKLVAHGTLGPAALHVAALERELFASVKLVRSIASWRQPVANPDTPGGLVNAVHGALRTYDLPDLVNAVGADRVEQVDPVGK